MNHCSQCGAPLSQAVPPGDDRPRHVCTACDTVHYVNPKTVVGCLVEHDGAVLLCKRAIEPAHGGWTLPAGFLELEESLAAGAARETWEEARAKVEIVAPLALFDLPHIGQNYVLFRARFAGDVTFEAGPESLDVRLARPDDIPWSDLAFPVMHIALRAWLDDVERGRATLRSAALKWRGTGSRFDPEQYDLVDLLETPLG